MTHFIKIVFWWCCEKGAPKTNWPQGPLRSWSATGCVGPYHMEQPPCWITDFITVFSDVCKKTPSHL